MADSNAMNDIYIRDTLMKLLENTARLDTRLDHLEDLIKDNKSHVEKLELRLSVVEANKNKIAGVAVAFSIIISIVAPMIRTALGG